MLLRPVSPVHRLEARSSPYFQVALYAGGQVLAVCICLLIWVSWDVLSAFQEPLLWAWLSSLSLRDVKRYLVTTARRELQSSSFLVCCAKLVFLPAVILWQLFEEVQEQLQAKYQELQAKTQANSSASPVPVGSAAGATPAAAAVTGLEDCRSSDEENDDSCSPQQQQRHWAPGGAAAAAEAAAEPATAGGIRQQSQQLRQRKPTKAVAGAGPPDWAQGQQQQQQKPPRHKANSSGQDRAAAAKPRHRSPGSGAQEQRVKKAAAAAAARSSRWQRRLRRAKLFAVRQLRWWWFCTVELFKFVFGGLLLPQKQRQQQQPPSQQQQQQQQQLYPAIGQTFSHASSIDTVAGSGVGPAGLRVSSSNSTGPLDFAGYSWQQQQQQQQQQQLLYPGHGWQQPQQPQQPSPHRLSACHSSPALNVDALQQQQQQQQQQQTLHGSSSMLGLADAGGSLLTPAVAAASAASLAFETAGSSRALASFNGWTQGLQQPAPSAAAPAQQQQQQQPALVLPDLSRCNSPTSSNSSSTAAAAAGTGAPGTSGRAPATSTGHTSPVGRSSAAAGDGGFVPWQYGGSTVQRSTPDSGGGVCDSFGLAGWESMHRGILSSAASGIPPPPPPGSVIAAAVGSPGSVRGAAAAAAGAAAGPVSPSAILFKWLLRAIVLYEGYSYGQALLWDADQPLLVLLVLLGGALALAGGLPFLLLPSSLWRSGLQDAADRADSTESQLQERHGSDCEPQAGWGGLGGGDAGVGSRGGMVSPFQQQQRQRQESLPAGRVAAAAAAAAGSGSMRRRRSGSGGGGRGSWLLGRAAPAVVSALVRLDGSCRAFCASGVLDTAVSALIVVGLILGSVVVSVVLLVQVGEESRSAVVHLNTLVRQKGSEAALTQGVWSLLQRYEGSITSALRDSLPGLTQMVETAATDFLVSHNMSRVLLDLEQVRVALRLPSDCSDEARVRLTLQLANSSLVSQQLGAQQEELQAAVEAEQAASSRLAADLEAIWLGASARSRQQQQEQQEGSGRGVACGGAPAAAPGAAAAAATAAAALSAGNTTAIAQQLLASQARLAKLQEQLLGVSGQAELAGESLQLAQLRLQYCQPSGPAAAAASHHKGGMSLGSLLLGFHQPAGQATGTSAGSGHLRRLLSAIAHFDLAAANKEAMAVLNHLHLSNLSNSSGGSGGGAGEACSDDAAQQQQQQLLEFGASEGGVPGAALPGDDGLLLFDNRSSSSNVTSSASLLAAAAAAQCSSPQGSSSPWSSSSSGSPGPASNTTAAASSGSASSSSFMRVAQGAAYPLISSAQRLSSVFLSGIGSTTAVALGTGLGLLRLGLGVVKFLVQLGVFASVLYTLLALDIDPVEYVLRLLPISEASQDRAITAVTKTMRGVFVSSLKLSAFHAGFTWLSLRAFSTHFVCLATAASAVVAVLPFVPVYLVALPGVAELVLLRGEIVAGAGLLAAHVAAYWFGDDLIYREIEPTLTNVVALGVFGGISVFKNPLQGAVVGPMCLALLSCCYNLHSSLTT